MTEYALLLAKNCQGVNNSLYRRINKLFNKEYNDTESHIELDKLKDLEKAAYEEYYYGYSGHGNFY